MASANESGDKRAGGVGGGGEWVRGQWVLGIGAHEGAVLRLVHDDVRPALLSMLSLPVWEFGKPPSGLFSVVACEGQAEVPGVVPRPSPQKQRVSEGTHILRLKRVGARVLALHGVEDGVGDDLAVVTGGALSYVIRQRALLPGRLACGVATAQARCARDGGRSKREAAQVLHRVDPALTCSTLSHNPLRQSPIQLEDRGEPSAAMDSDEGVADLAVDGREARRQVGAPHVEELGEVRLAIAAELGERARRRPEHAEQCVMISPTTTLQICELVAELQGDPLSLAELSRD